MVLLERVATLLRANVNDLIDRSENPEKMLKQLVLDMENQLLQVKTQVAIALADQHLLEKKTREQEELLSDWRRRAELAVTKGDDVLARAALGRVLSQGGTVEAFRAQVSEQTAEAEALRGTYVRLQSKLAETRSRCELLLSQHRRARLATHTSEVHGVVENSLTNLHALDRVRHHVAEAEAQGEAAQALVSPEALEDRLEQLEKDDRVEQMLTDLKTKQQRLLPTG